jgi:GATA-binding protein, other eukaryote
MAASTATMMATPSPSTAMNPTTTEHDFRFPRRPNDIHQSFKTDYDAASPSHAIMVSAGDLRASLQELKLDLTATYNIANEELLRSAAFPTMQNGTAGMSQSPEQLQKADPLATQVWKFFSRTKQLLPNQERMENLTWRMMHMNLRKKRMEEHRR